ncbi:hypothetical protein SASPL_155853 [Salvia splendens]|uniref:Uncharacterized protein n=1 Tax=Salvia splendens TaxID=180675 RepID=A0A8X8VXL7_SALSN|nr:hypothetical protein SASPL_155853 [Salvia splendens]
MGLRNGPHPRPRCLPPRLPPGGAGRPVGLQARRHAPALRGVELPHLPAPPRRPLPNALRSFLMDQNVIRVALWDHAIWAMLWSSRHALLVGDVRRAAYALMRCGRGATMGQLAEEIMGIPGMRMDEAAAYSDWEDQQLTHQQIQYACHAVFLPFLIAVELHLWEYFL